MSAIYSRELTEVERRVMGMVAAGRSNASIARELGITEAGVQRTVDSALDRLGALNRAEGVRMWRAGEAQRG